MSQSSNQSHRSLGMILIALAAAAVLCGAFFTGVISVKEHIQYNNYEYFDYSEAIQKGIASKQLVPDPAPVPFTVAAANGATGVCVVSSNDASQTHDVYLNAYIAKQPINVTAAEGYTIKSINGEEGKTSFVPETLVADALVDQLIPVVVEGKDGTTSTYTIHTVPQGFPKIEITGTGVAESDAGVYTWQEHGFFLQVDTNKNLIYFRDMRCMREGNPNANIGDFNFQPHQTSDGMFYSYAVVLGRQVGFCEGYFVVMDQNYKEIDTVTLMANDSPNHKHGEGYLDFHEFRVLGPDNYLVMGYNQALTKLPKGIKGLEGTGDFDSAYIWLCTIQQQKNGKIVLETSSTDFPLFFDAAAEDCDYAASTAEKPSDYMHCNAYDYIVDDNGNITKLLVSYRNLESLVQYDVKNGDALTLDWIYSGKASTLKLDDRNGNCEIRTDDMGNEFLSAEFGQHCCRYVVENGKKNPYKISVYDNDTGVADAGGMAYNTADKIPTMSRTYWFTIDGMGQTKMDGIITAEHMMEVNKAANGGEYTSYYISDHCAGVEYLTPTSVFTGSGLCMMTDFSSEATPKVDSNYPDLKLYSGVHPVLTDYNPQTDQITFELKCFCGENGANGYPMIGPGHYVYRSYKTMGLL